MQIPWVRVLLWSCWNNRNYISCDWLTVWKWPSERKLKVFEQVITQSIETKCPWGVMYDVRRDLNALSTFNSYYRFPQYPSPHIFLVHYRKKVSKYLLVTVKKEQVWNSLVCNFSRANWTQRFTNHLVDTRPQLSQDVHVMSRASWWTYYVAFNLIRVSFSGSPLNLRHQLVSVKITESVARTLANIQNGELCNNKLIFFTR